MVNNRRPRQHFNTDTLRERDRFPAFREEMFRRIIGADIATQGPTPFQAAVEVRRAGPVIIANIAATPIKIVRNASHVADGNDAIVVQLWGRGGAHVTQGQRETSVLTRQGVILDNKNTGALSTHVVGQAWTLTIERDKIVGLQPRIAELAAIALSDSSPLQLLFGYLEGTIGEDFSDPSVGQVFGNHLVELIALAIARGDELHELEVQDGVRAARYHAILQAIADQSANPHLNAFTVAAQLGVTPRYVHLLLEQSGQTFTQLLLRKRLEKARELLTGIEGRNKRIVDIAFQVGFADLSHFNRAFRFCFGDTPSGVRATSH
jgi:AraC-like DNA-binding protein